MKTINKKQTWGIIGLGWLGVALAQRLSSLGHLNWGTTRRTFTFGSKPFPQTACDVLFLNTPPLTQLPPQDFVRMIELRAESKLIFISSTGIYGKNSGRVTETTKPEPNSNSGHWLLETETQLRTKFADQLTIVRPGGLIGSQRHPVHSLSGRSDVPGADSPINLIHRDDLIEIIINVAQHSKIKLLNAVAPYHPTKRSYYNDWAKKLNLSEVQFSEQGTSDRIVDSEYIDEVYRSWKHQTLDCI